MPWPSGKSSSVMLQKVAVKREFEAGLRHATTGKLSLFNPAVNRYLFSNLGRIRQRKERDGLLLSSGVPKIKWDSNPHCPCGYKAMGNLYLYTSIPTKSLLRYIFGGKVYQLLKYLVSVANSNLQ